MSYIRLAASYLVARPLVALAGGVALLLVLTTTIVVVTSSSRHSEQSFCTELRAGNERLQRNASAGGNSTGGQLAAVLVNLSEFNRLLHRLDDRAPDEIQSDMDAVVKMWDQQQDRLGNAAKDPLGALAAGLISSILNSASVNAVESYATSHCHLALFGSLGGASTGGNNSAGGWSCNSDPPTLASPQTKAEQLTAWLDGMKGAAAALASAAAALRNPLARLAPPPSTALEGLGRLRFAHVDTPALLENLNSAYNSVCGSTPIPDADLATIRDNNGPMPLNGGLNPGNGGLFWQCSTLVGYSAPLLVAYDCGDGTVITLDGTTGVLTRGKGFPVSSAQHVRLAGDKLVYATYDVSPAQGLNPAGWTEQLHVRNLDGSGTIDVEVMRGSNEPPSSDPLAGGWSDRIAISTPTELRLYDIAGKQLWSAPAESTGNSGAARLTPGLLLYRRAVLDVNTGHQLLNALSDVLTDHCGAAATLTTYGYSEVSWVSDDAAVRRLTGFDLNKGSFTVGGGHVLHDSGSELEGLTTEGQRGWSVPNNIAYPRAYLGRWVVMENQSHAPVLVDAATGADVTASQPEVARILFRVASGFDVLGWDDDALLVKGADIVSNHPAVLRLPRKLACG